MGVNDHLWSKAQVAAEREYRFQERLGMLSGADPEPPSLAVEMAGAEVRAWERLMDFTPATADQKAGQMALL
jgi:hypothetical protein